MPGHLIGVGGGAERERRGGRVPHGGTELAPQHRPRRLASRGTCSDGTGERRREGRVSGERLGKARLRFDRPSTVQRVVSGTCVANVAGDVVRARDLEERRLSEEPCRRRARLGRRRLPADVRGPPRRERVERDARRAGYVARAVGSADVGDALGPDQPLDEGAGRRVRDGGAAAPEAERAHGRRDDGRGVRVEPARVAGEGERRRDERLGRGQPVGRLDGDGQPLDEADGRRRPQAGHPELARDDVGELVAERALDLGREHVDLRPREPDRHDARLARPDEAALRVGVGVEVHVDGRGGADAEAGLDLRQPERGLVEQAGPLGGRRRAEPRPARRRVEHDPAAGRPAVQHALDAGCALDRSQAVRKERRCPEHGEADQGGGGRPGPSPAPPPREREQDAGPHERLAAGDEQAAAERQFLVVDRPEDAPVDEVVDEHLRVEPEAPHGPAGRDGDPDADGRPPRSPHAGRDEGRRDADAEQRARGHEEREQADAGRVGAVRAPQQRQRQPRKRHGQQRHRPSRDTRGALAPPERPDARHGRHEKGDGRDDGRRLGVQHAEDRNRPQGGDDDRVRERRREPRARRWCKQDDGHTNGEDAERPRRRVRHGLSQSSARRRAGPDTLRRACSWSPERRSGCPAPSS